MYDELDERREWIGKKVVDIAYHIHKALGPGLLEKVYEACFCYVLYKRDIPFAKQKEVAIIYDDVVFDKGLRLDILVDDLVIIELKAQEEYHKV